jgi:hypothetical protein
VQTSRNVMDKPLQQRLGEGRSLQHNRNHTILGVCFKQPTNEFMLSCTFLANAGCPVHRVGETQVTVELRVCRASIARRLCRQLLEEIAATFAGSAFALPCRILEETCKCTFPVCPIGIRPYDGARHEPNRSTGQADDLVRTGCKRLLYRPRSPILQGTRHSWSRWLHTTQLRKDA